MLAEIIGSQAAAEILMWVLGALGGWIASHLLPKIGSAWAREALARAGMEVRAAVLEVHQTYVTDIKAASADGTLTEEEKDQAYDHALKIAKSNLGKKGLARLARALGLANVDEWLGNRIEANVAELRLSSNPQ